MKFILQEVCPNLLFSDTFNLLRCPLKSWSFEIYTSDFICIFFNCNVSHFCQTTLFWSFRALIKINFDIDYILIDWLIFGSEQLAPLNLTSHFEILLIVCESIFHKSSKNFLNVQKCFVKQNVAKKTTCKIFAYVSSLQIV